MMQKESISNFLSLYGTGEDYTVKLKIRLTDPIDEVILQEALNETMKRFPYYCGKYVIEGESIAYVEDSLPFKVFHKPVDDASLVLGGEETNFHLAAVEWDGDMICLDMSHTITDGTGMYHVLQALLYHYCQAKYDPNLDKGGCPWLEDQIDEAEYADPGALLPHIDVSGIKRPETEWPFSITKDGGLPRIDNEKMVDIELSQEEIMAFSRNNDSTPGVMTSLFLAKAVDALNPGRTKPIIHSYVMNTRPMIGFQKAYPNCVSAVNLRFTDQIKALSTEIQGTGYRGQTILQTDPDRVLKGEIFRASGTARLVGIPSLAKKKEIARASMNTGFNMFTFMVSYVGKANFGGIEKYIKEFWLHTQITSDILVELSAVNDKIYLSWHQIFDGDQYLDAFLHQLDIEHLHYEVKHRGPNDNPKICRPGC